MEHVLTDLIAAHPSRQDALLPVLHAVQHAFGWIPPETMLPVANALNIGHAEVWGVVSFYEHFRTKPAGGRVLRLCRAEACQAMGAKALEALAKERLGIDFHETTPDGALSLEPAYCLGVCACAPALSVDDEPAGRITPERLAGLLDQLRQERAA